MTCDPALKRLIRVAAPARAHLSTDIPCAMRLDIVIPTFNRADLLERTLASIHQADPVEDLDVRVVVVDNNSTDRTADTVRRHEASFGGRLTYVFESRPGRSNALNAGIAASDGELVGMIDDDEEIDSSWFRVIRAVFAQPDIDFIGGPCLPRWGAPRPAWLSMERPAIVGWIEGGDEVREYEPGFEGILMGGNAVVRRALLRRVGPYAAKLGRAGSHQLMSGEDREMHDRLIRAGGRGQFRPELRIYHFVPPERLTKQYHRRWVFWHGVSLGLLDRTRPQSVAYLGSVPRYMIGSALRGLGRLLMTLLTKRGGDRSRIVFEEELRLIDLVGFVWGKHIYRAPADAAPQATTTSVPAPPAPEATTPVRASPAPQVDKQEVAHAPPG